MEPFWQEINDLYKKILEEKCVHKVYLHVVPRQFTWVWPERNLHNRIALGPQNPKYWWILPPNYIPF